MNWEEMLALLPGSGEIRIWAGATAPDGWLLCEGQAVTSANPGLRRLLLDSGSPYGVSGSDPLAPNLKGRVPVGRDAAQTEFDALGETGGAKTHTLTTAEMPAHTHEQVMTTQNFVGGVYGPARGEDEAGPTASGHQTASTGGGGAHNNLQPYLAINFIIKT